MSFTLGYTTAPNGSYNYTQVNTGNQLGWKINAGSTGASVASISAYFASKAGGGTVSAAFCIWNSSGTLLASTPRFNITAGSGGAGGQRWYTQSFSTPYTIAASTDYYVGWWRDPSKSQEWSENSSGLTEWLSANTSGSPGNMGTNTAGTGQPGIYATCNYLGGVKIWNGSAENKNKCKTWNGSAWIWNEVKDWQGSSWVHNG